MGGRGEGQASAIKAPIALTLQAEVMVGTRKALFPQ